jgi:glycine/D-amino acid oxidase-like deaminating enzyme/NADPH-dependent 2,4-dienoyl-CoA reductase/sulfur reductase-like enzyme/Fe-S-cluster-containing hydrogenase component 2
MERVLKHPILEIPSAKERSFIFNNMEVKGLEGFTIAAALHQAGFPVHSHSIENRKRSLECGIGKCGACEMLVDGEIKRICITLIDGVNEVKEIPVGYQPEYKNYEKKEPDKVFRTTVAIAGAGPAGLAAREMLNNHGIDNIVIDNNEHIGGQFLMQTHQFFFFEKEQKFGGMRGFDIAKTLAGNSQDGIMLNSTIWDILEGKRLAVKNIKTGEIYFIDASYLIVATGAVPFMPSFGNDDLPGVYTAAVVQKMMNQEFTLLGKNILTVGAGNIGYLTSYQLKQAGANVKAIIEAMPNEGGFPVQANRVRRLGIPVLLSHILVKAIPNATGDGITGAVIAECHNFKPVPGTEKVIDGIDAINICTGLTPDNQLLIKGREIFGTKAFGAGDAIRIGEGTSAVLRGKQAAYDVLQDMEARIDYNDFLSLSKEYIDSQQHPVRIIESPYMPTGERMKAKPFVLIDCLYGFACNPCQFACPQGAIQKISSNTVPTIDFDKCIGCMKCVYQCPGLAIFGYNAAKNQLFLPVEYYAKEGAKVCLVDNNGRKVGKGIIDKILVKENKTNIARVNATELTGTLTDVRGFIIEESYPEPVEFKSVPEVETEEYVCHCDDVSLEKVLNVIGERKYISVDEIKHTTRLGMGPCRGKRCIRRLSQLLRARGVELVGDATPRAPLSNQISMGELYPSDRHEIIITPGNKKRIKVGALVAGGGMAGTAVFRYLAEAGLKPVLANYQRGSSWRNIAGGRPNFSVPELSEIARQNLSIFKNLQSLKSIDYRAIDYVTFAHDDETYKALEASMAWSGGEMILPDKYASKIAPGINPKLKDNYISALITHDCWQATPGKVIDLVRNIGISKGGVIEEDCQIIDIEKKGKNYIVLTSNHKKEYIEYETPLFINAMGAEGDIFAKKLNIFTGLYPVRHQAFITRRLPWLGANNAPMPMLIDRRKYKGFVAVYGQQLAETGQIIGCASPATDPAETGKSLKVNSEEFMHIFSEVFVNWLPELASVGFQSFWSGYYTEPRMVIDPELGLFLGLRGQGFMLSMYIAKMYVDKLNGKPVPEYFDRLSINGDGMLEKAFK